MTLTEADVTRFWAYVSKTPTCWLWMGATRPRFGQGMFWITREGKQIYRMAHNISWEQHNGPVPAQRLVRQTCTNPACVCPEHLYLEIWCKGGATEEDKRTKFFRRVPAVPNARGCLEWTGSFFKVGYPQFCFAGTKLYGHRVAYELVNGEIPKGQSVLHECDNPKCVNPRHLFLGTMKENMDDKIAKGRNAVGAQQNLGALDHEKAAAIRYLRAAGMSREAVAAKFGVTPTTISRVTAGKAWM